MIWKLHHARKLPMTISNFQGPMSFGIVPLNSAILSTTHPPSPSIVSVLKNSVPDSYKHPIPFQDQLLHLNIN